MEYYFYRGIHIYEWTNNFKAILLTIPSRVFIPLIPFKNPTPTPENPYPWSRVGILRGKGQGSHGMTPGLPLTILTRVWINMNNSPRVSFISPPPPYFLSHLKAWQRGLSPLHNPHSKHKTGGCLSTTLSPPLLETRDRGDCLPSTTTLIPSLTQTTRWRVLPSTTLILLPHSWRGSTTATTPPPLPHFKCETKGFSTVHHLPLDTHHPSPASPCPLKGLF